MKDGYECVNDTASLKLTVDLYHSIVKVVDSEPSATHFTADSETRTAYNVQNAALYVVACDLSSSEYVTSTSCVEAAGIYAQDQFTHTLCGASNCSGKYALDAGYATLYFDSVPAEAELVSDHVIRLSGTAYDLDSQAGAASCPDGSSGHPAAIFGALPVVYCSKLPLAMLYVNATTGQYQTSCTG